MRGGTKTVGDIDARLDAAHDGSLTETEGNYATSIRSFVAEVDAAATAADLRIDAIAEALRDGGMSASAAAMAARRVLASEDRVLAESGVGEEAPRAKAQESDLSRQLARVVGELLMGGNIELNAHALALALGMNESHAMGGEVGVANRLGLTRSMVSQKVNHWCDHLGVRLPQYTRSELTRERCAQAQTKKHRTLCWK